MKTCKLFFFKLKIIRKKMFKNLLFKFIIYIDSFLLNFKYYFSLFIDKFFIQTKIDKSIINNVYSLIEIKILNQKKINDEEIEKICNMDKDSIELDYIFDDNSISEQERKYFIIGILKDNDLVEITTLI